MNTMRFILLNIDGKDNQKGSLYCLFLIFTSMITVLKNCIYKGSEERESLYDLTIPENFNGKLVVFIHGYMGFKDWGCWSLVENYFVSRGFGFCKYNVSHNGGTIDQPIDFPDLDAFSRNRYSYELNDLDRILNVLEEKVIPFPEICLIGHSRGGGIALLKLEDPRVKKVASWAGISTIETRFPKGEALEDWKNKGVRYGMNSRTHQHMPHLFDQYTDYLEHRNQLDIQRICSLSKKPVFIAHGDKDTSVDISECYALSKVLEREPVIIQGADHTFGSSQPWGKPDLPAPLATLCKITADFFEKENT